MGKSSVQCRAWNTTGWGESQLLPIRRARQGDFKSWKKRNQGETCSLLLLLFQEAPTILYILSNLCYLMPSILRRVGVYLNEAKFFLKMQITLEDQRLGERHLREGICLLRMGFIQILGIDLLREKNWGTTGGLSKRQRKAGINKS